MSASNDPYLPATGDVSSHVHRNTYRIICLLAGIISPAFGIIYTLVEPGAVDPLWARFAVAGVTLLLPALSLQVDWVDEHFIPLAQGLFYFSTAYFVGLTYLNGFTGNYALGALMSISGFGVGFSLGTKRVRPLVLYLVTFTVLSVGAVVLVPNPQVDPAIMSISVATVCVVIFIVARAKIQAEAVAVSSERRYQYVHTLINAANDAIFIANPQDGKLVEVNRKAQQLVGRSREELLGQPLKQLYPPNQREQFTNRFEEHVLKEQAGTETLNVVHQSGRVIPVDVNASLIEVDGTRLIQGIFRDATERQEYEQQLIAAKEHAEELLKMKTSFLNNMSHELRTPLTSILGYAEVLHEEETSETQQAFAERILDSAKRLRTTLNSVLDLAQLESGKATLDLAQVDVAQETREAVSLLEPIAAKKGIELETVVTAKDTHATADTACIDRITNNLVGNAIKFTDEGRVTVEVGATDDAVFIKVKDTGIGMDDAFLDHLFDEFRQESTGLQRTHEGTGLGLAITKRLVDLLNGHIEVESQKGVGSCFTVYLPRSVPDEQPAPAPAAPPPDAAEAPFFDGSVLVVEDNALTRELIDHHLRPHCDVEVVANPEDAIVLASEHQFDVVVLDIHLSASADGIELLQRLRTMNGYAHTPAVALTAYAMPSDRDQFIDAGFDFHLCKPFTRDQLVETLNHAWSESSAMPPS
jgi:PAS domain S-box-containing protein